MIATALWVIAIVMFICILYGFSEPPRSDGLLKPTLILVLSLIGLALTGCSTLRPDGYGTELKHDSGLLIDGRGSDGRLREDSLDVWNNYVYWQRGSWYAEAGIGLKLREGGFYLDGPPVVFNGRVGRRFGFWE